MIDLPGPQQPGRVAAAGDAEPPPGLVEVAIDGMLRNPQAAGDFLGVQVLGDQPETLPLARGQALDRRWVVLLPHDRRGKSPARLSSIPLVNPATTRH
ncbi:MAG TPA: hypothetical protein PLO65_10975 [Caulobacter sp.]|nr:hypothetical protein [Caulobacter sp.]